jgi:amylosucrase
LSETGAECMTKDERWLDEQAASSLKRLLPRLEARLKDRVDSAEWHGYVARLRRHFPRLFTHLFALYGESYDFFYYLEAILASTTEMWIDRPADLKALDALREADPSWYQSNRMVGAMCYVDLFAGDIEGLCSRIPYLSELGITYLHLMPLFKAPQGDNDGGYAVTSYREINPALGTMEQLNELANELRHHGISLTLDFVFNHTSDENEWAQRALAGQKEYQAGGVHRGSPGGLHLPYSDQEVGVDHLPHLPVGPQLREPRGLQQDA